MGGLKGRDFFLTVLEVGSLRPGLGSDASLHLGNSCLLARSSYSRESMLASMSVRKGGRETALRGLLIRALIPLWGPQPRPPWSPGLLPVCLSVRTPEIGLGPTLLQSDLILINYSSQDSLFKESRILRSRVDLKLAGTV